MTPLDALNELLGRVKACRGAPVQISDEELGQWPREAVKAMKSQRVLVRSRPAKSVICPGCECECVMPVHTPLTEGAPAAFVVCDKRSDTNRVAVAAERLIQWQCNVELICGFVAASLGLRRSSRQAASAAGWEIGLAAGDKRRQMLCLKTDGELFLKAGENKVPLAELIEFQGGEFSLDNQSIRRLVDTATTPDSRYTPTQAKREARKLNTQTLHESWKKAYRTLKKKHPNMSDVWCSRKIAKMDIAEGRTAETIRKRMK